MIPVYGFMEGDSLGLLIFTYESDTVAEVANKVLVSSRCRVKPTDPAKLSLFFDGKRMEPYLTMQDIGIQPLSMIEVKKSRLEQVNE